MSIADQTFNSTDEDYLFKFFNDDAASSVEYSSESSSLSPQAVPSSSPENCSWDPFELNPFDNDFFIPQVKKEDKFSNSNCFSNLYQPIAVLPPDTKNINMKETGKKRSIHEILETTDTKNFPTKIESQISPNNFPQRPISIEEEKKIKKQRRLIKNRESAQLSRLRKKQYIENLENQVKKLANDNSILNKHIETVQSQNLALQEEVIYLRGVINNKQDNNQNNFPNLKARNTATAGVCLLLILFSFGLFFNQSQIQNSSPLALPASSSSAPQTFYKGLTLKEQPPSPPLPSETKVEQTSLQAQSSSDLEPKRKRAKIQVINEEEDDPFIPMAKTSSSSSTPPHALSSIESSEIKPSNNSYIYCPEAHQLVSETANAPNDFEFPIVSILLPSVSLSGILPDITNHIDNPEQTLLEVSCKILNINVYPFFPDVSSANIVPPIAIGSL